MVAGQEWAAAFIPREITPPMRLLRSTVTYCMTEGNQSTYRRSLDIHEVAKLLERLYIVSRRHLSQSGL